MDVSKSPSDMALSSAVPRAVLQRFSINKSPPKCLEAVAVHACVVFADVSGFTKMAETLSAKGHVGVEELTSHLNKYFDKMIGIIIRHGGDVIRFAGDALLLLWMDDEEYHTQVSEMDKNADSIWTREDETSESIKARMHKLCQLGSQCALDLLHTLNDYEIEDGLRLYLHAGIGCGKVQLVHVGVSESRVEFALVGEPISQITSALDRAARGQIVLSPKCHNLMKDSCQGHLLEDGHFMIQRCDHISPKVPALTSFGDASTRKLLQPYVVASVYDRLCAGYAKKMLNEIRRVSVMFACIPGLDFKTAKNAQKAQRLMVSSLKILDKTEGSMRQFMMDDKGCVLIACYGLPSQSHEDDPFRCVTAAQSLKREASLLGITCSIGVTSGTVFCGAVGNDSRWEYAMVGDLVNLASRLSHASTMDIICDEQTSKGCKEKGLPLDTLDPITVKGKSKPIQIFRAKGAAVPLTKPVSQGAEFVGRSQDKIQIHEILDSTIRDQQSRVILLDGDAGIGKSSFVLEIEQIATNLHLPYISLQTGKAVGSVLRVWKTYLSTVSRRNMKQIEDLISHVPLRSDGTPDIDFIITQLRMNHTKEAGSTLAPSHNIPPNLEQTPSSASLLSPTHGQSLMPNMPQLPNSTDYGDQGSPQGAISDMHTPRINSRPMVDLGNNRTLHPRRERLNQRRGSAESTIGAENEIDGETKYKNTEIIINAVFQRKIQERGMPLVLIVDDYNHLDELSKQVLVSVTKNVSPLICILAERTGTTGPSITELMKVPKIIKHRLLGLIEDDVMKITRNILRVDSISPQMETYLVGKSLGNPFLLIQLINSAKDAGYIVIDANTKSARFSNAIIESGKVDLPDTISGIIASRLDRIDFTKQILLKVASCIGEVFPLSLIKRLISNLRTEADLWQQLAGTVEDDLNALVERQFLETTFSATSARGANDADSGLAPRPLKESRSSSDKLYRFTNSSTREVVRGLMLHEHRKAISRQIALLFEELFQGQLDAYYKDLAEHWRQAGDLAKAVNYYGLAGVLSLENKAMNDAVEFLEEAIKLSNESTSVQPYMLVKWYRCLGEAHTARGRMETGHKAFMQGLASVGPLQLISMGIFETPETPTLKAWANFKTVMKSSLRLWRLRRIQNSATESTEESLLRLEIAKILHLYTSSSFWYGHYDPRMLFEVCLATVDVGYPLGCSNELAQALFFASTALDAENMRFLGRIFRTESFRIVNLTGDWRSIMQLNRVSFLSFINVGDFEGALGVLNEAEMICNRHSHSRHAFYTEYILSSRAACYFYWSKFNQGFETARKCEGLTYGPNFYPKSSLHRTLFRIFCMPSNCENYPLF
eukprot:TRINITY_DN5386_c0_g1_i2.p1 TRINITY_DN5386_c0_g1~~TRINITY_DN5386_c0_g1_i2.p1  ORF type:complete len:1340 (+),score=232.44 TRINITY_DN5386_c0_g1_i2:133-4152(+)